MASVVALVDDLLFGSNLVGALRAAGHQVTLVADASRAAGAASGADVLIVDLASGTIDPAALLVGVTADGRPATLASYAHVHPEMRAAAEAAGFDRVVPRSRLAREAPVLVSALAGSPPR